MPRPSHHDAIVDAGLRTFFRKGYIGSSVRDVTAAAGVPQGSFTNHFASKEQFAGEVLDSYFAHTRRVIGQTLGNRSLSPRARLVRYLDVITDRLADDGYERGCLIGDLSIEAPGHSENLRHRLQEIYREWVSVFEDCIREAQEIGEIPDRFAAADLATFLLNSWEGAILRMKVERDPAPLEIFRRIAFDTIFQERS